jgi:hypothetical protein
MATFQYLFINPTINKIIDQINTYYFNELAKITKRSLDLKNQKYINFNLLKVDEVTLNSINTLSYNMQLLISTIVYNQNYFTFYFDSISGKLIKSKHFFNISILTFLKTLTSFKKIYTNNIIIDLDIYKIEEKIYSENNNIYYVKNHFNNIEKINYKPEISRYIFQNFDSYFIHNQITNLHIKDFKFLDIYVNNKHFINLKNLKFLEIDKNLGLYAKCCIEKVFYDLANYNNIESIVIKHSDCFINIFNISNLIYLETHINKTNNHLLGNLINLTQLCIDGDYNLNMTDSIYKLTKLQKLQIKGFSCLSNNISKLKNLQYLELDYFNYYHIYNINLQNLQKLKMITINFYVFSNKKSLILSQSLVNIKKTIAVIIKLTNNKLFNQQPYEIPLLKKEINYIKRKTQTLLNFNNIKIFINK